MSGEPAQSLDTLPRPGVAIPLQRWLDLLAIENRVVDLARENAKLREACHVFIEARKHGGYGMDDAEKAIRAALPHPQPDR